jgi:hypothetical protein
LPERDQSELQRARIALDAKDWPVARAILERALEERPDDVGVALLLQDAELGAVGGEPQRLIERARERAAGEGGFLAHLLVARLDPDPAAALAAARASITADPKNPWGHYAEAYLLALGGDWTGAQASNARALDLDGGHRSAARLEAAILARAGKLDAAIIALRAWLDAVASDPRVAPSARVAARLDLAQLLVLARQDDDALAELVRLPEVGGASLRRACLEAAALQGLGRPGEALAASERAAAAEPNALAPLVQQALLQEHHLRDAQAARALWERVLASEGARAGLGSLLETLRARIALERSGVGTP